MCLENQAFVWYNGQGCITLFHLWGTGCARRNVGKIVPSFKVSSSYCEKNKVSKREVVSEILSEKRIEKKEEKCRMIDCFFDFGITWSDGSKITQEQWIAILKENSIEVSIATFKRYLKDRGYSKRRKNKKVSLPKPIYNHFSIRFNDDTFDEEVEHDESLVSFGRKFAEIIERYHDSDEFRKTWRA